MHNCPISSCQKPHNFLRIGLTGAEGFLGRHVQRAATEERGVVIFALARPDWKNPGALAAWSNSCDVIVHLAGLSRSDDGEALYRTNMELCTALAGVLRGGQRLIFGSTIHAYRKNLPYHASKRDGAALFYEAAARRKADFVELLMPNAFGEGGKPFFNSVIATFCFQAARRLPMRIDAPDATLELIYAADLGRNILNCCRDRAHSGQITVPVSFHPTLGQVAASLQSFAAGRQPAAGSAFEQKLFRTWQSYLG